MMYPDSRALRWYSRLDRVEDPLISVILGGDCLEGFLVVDGVLLAILVRVPHLLASNELLERLYLAGGSDEAVPQQLLSGRPAVAILGEALGDEITEVFAEIVVQRRRRVFGDVEEDLHGVDVGEGGFSICQLHGSNAQRPDVSLEAVPVLLDDLGGHPEWGPDECVALGLDVGQLSGDTKVSQFDLARLRQQDIGSLDVSMNFALFVKILDAQKKLSANNGNMCLADVGWFQLRRALA